MPATETGLLIPLILAGAGGFLLNMINLWEDSKKAKVERVPKDGLWWVFFFFWPLAGAFLAWLYTLEGSALRPWLALSIGVSAPTTIQAMAAKAATRPSPPPAGAEP